MSMTDSLVSTVTDGRKTQGKTPVYRPMVNGEELDITVSRMQMSLGEFQHEVATIVATTSALVETATLKGSAISFYFGLSPHTELFIGYIDTVKDDQNQTGAGLLAFTMTCLGSTKSMQVGIPRFYSNSTIPMVVENLAYQGSLGFHGHDHPLVWPVLAQTEETDWAFASALAKRLGWTLLTRYGVVMLYNPRDLFTNNGSFMDLVSAQYSSTAYADYERALIEFTPMESSDTSYRQVGAKISYFNGEIVQTVTQRGDKYTRFKYLTNIVTRGPEEAEIYANATFDAATFWSQQATARVLGNANLFPGMCVDIYTTNPKYYKDRYNGRWFIRGVQHVADRQTFQTELVLSRPDSGTGVSMAPYVSFWNEASKARPTMTLYEGRWQSSWTDTNARSVA